MTGNLMGAVRREARVAPVSGIVEAIDYGRDRDGLIPLWAGEGDRPTPDFICRAADRSLRAGETFYTWQRGLPALREALARYHSRLFGGSFEAERFIVTGSGMQAIQIAVDCVAGAGEEIIVPSPAWPNIGAALGIGGAAPRFVPLTFEDDGWRLDLDQLSDAIGPATRGLFINTPSNPTGWTASEAELQAILAMARARGLWIIADEVYTRFFYGGPRAPSFHDVAEPDDRILFVNTFSKNWAMTGWRIGWIEAPVAMAQILENLVQYSTSGVAAFMQRAAITALDEGEPFVKSQIAQAGEGRRIICEALEGSNRVRFAWPAGAFYLLFSIENEADTRAVSKRLIDDIGIGLAPGTAFGPGGEAFLRLCFARRAEDLRQVVDRLTGWLGG